VPRAGDSGAFFAFLLNPRLGLRCVGVVNPVFSFTLNGLSRVLSQAELSRECLPTSAASGTERDAVSLQIKDSSVMLGVADACQRYYAGSRSTVFTLPRNRVHTQNLPPGIRPASNDDAPSL